MPEQDPEEIQKLEEMKKLVLRKILSRPAMERLSRIRLVKPDIATQLEMYLVNLYQSGKIRSEISEEQIKMILETISESGARREFRISRK